ncbi:MAG: hypothetical protein BJ554DRAFT_803 [Olpidium bornovanus]|uniref:Uncharacterized protein n=1 Tax=Olpidium bornovanus TaxID=278681 RepID=A0A8H8DHV5_9FUNG|nr:MAG: hypothetical protein BJ554DRAFT_803 [Olpidium bornovanus]
MFVTQLGGVAQPCTGLDDALFNKLTASGAKKYIRTLKELFVDFLGTTAARKTLACGDRTLAVESQVFCLHMPNSLYYLFSPDAPTPAFNGDLEMIAKHVSSAPERIEILRSRPGRDFSLTHSVLHFLHLA